MPPCCAGESPPGPPDLRARAWLRAWLRARFRPSSLRAERLQRGCGRRRGFLRALRHALAGRRGSAGTSFLSRVRRACLTASGRGLGALPPARREMLPGGCAVQPRASCRRTRSGLEITGRGGRVESDSSFLTRFRSHFLTSLVDWLRRWFFRIFRILQILFRNPHVLWNIASAVRASPNLKWVQASVTL